MTAQENRHENKTFTAVIADDHAIVRTATKHILHDIGNITVVAEASNGLEAIATVKSFKPDLLVLDAAMPFTRGIEVFTTVRRWSPATKVALLTGFTSVGFLSDWLNAGVDGLLLKTCEPIEMTQCFTALLAGSNFIAVEISTLLKNTAPRPTLTARELEVLTLLASGNMNKTIADQLAISPKTVEKHRASLMAKLGVHSMAKLLVYALKEGLLDEHQQL